MNHLTREDFEKIIDDNFLNTKDVFDSVNTIISNELKDDIKIDINDIIEYAQMRYWFWEYPKSIYYCYYGLTQNVSNEQKIKLIENIISCLNNLINHDIVENSQNSLSLKSKDTKPLIDLIRSTKIDTISLTSYSSRKQSQMPRIDLNLEKEIYNNYQDNVLQWNYQNAFYEIYFLFSNKYLKKNISNDNILLWEFKNFCKKWIKEIQ